MAHVEQGDQSGQGAQGDEVVRRWKRHPQVVRLARAGLRTALAGWGLGAIEGDALLVLSELLTNSVRHAGGSSWREVETRFLLRDGGLRVEVHDASSRLPRPGAPRWEAEGGRGLLVVAAVADDWGCGDRNGPGKYVWAELAPRPAVDEPGRKPVVEARHG
ncbi:hypothetical protein B7C62_12895 [Kitasatospora albolonga]|uniref:Histidine kinase/HSP90-like ATPase domain-containing protein n=1 Tax=Kitasatospora albolonga TaxID=68173 RepID=A0ABC8BT21_9ACTN|nr:hypothetical protein B7C62_12895 [Kitasatospora albolonga]